MLAPMSAERDVERFSIPFPDHPVGRLEAELGRAAGAPDPRHATAVLLAHGAGFHMRSPFMTNVAEGLRARGLHVLRFNYPYRQRALDEDKQRPPDRMPVLEEAHRTALSALLERVDAERIVLAGKSLGARVGSHLAAKGEPCHGLVHLGYPLHPPKKPERLRDEHFAAIAQPSLFLQGTRDALCDLTLLARSLERYGGSARVEVIQDADHGFHVLARTKKSDATVLEELLDLVRAWVEATFPDRRTS